MNRLLADPMFDIGKDLQRAYDEGYKQGRYDEMVETEMSLPKWIPVSERLPEAEESNTHKGDVLLWVRNKNRPERGANCYLGKLLPVPPDDGHGNFFGVKCAGSEWTIWGWSYYAEPEVLAWMPLPEPYKGGDTE